jgi:8-oxo-dGTP pyrophosphatase MutT (NUDIX family)
MHPKEPFRVRAAGIVIRGDDLLVMFRRRDGREYYTFPGGMIEKDESPEEAVVREIREEATIGVEVLELLYELNRPGELPREFFYRCAYKTGEARLDPDSIEQKINDPKNNFFEPKWMKLIDLQKEPLFPTEVAAQLFHDLKHGFQNEPVKIEGSTIGG